MRTGLGICIVSMAWLATCLVPTVAIHPHEYLQLSSQQELASSPLTGQIMEAIERLQIGQNEQANNLMERIRSLAKDDRTIEPDIKSIYERLAQLADESDICSDELIGLSKHIVAMARHHVKPASKLDSLMRHFGGLKFDACLKRHQGYFHILLGLFVEESLDDVLAAALGISERAFKKTSDQEKYEKLQALNLIDDKKLNVASMAKRAADYEPKTGDDLSLVMNFFDAKCNSLQEMLGSVLDILALARVFEADVLTYRKRLLKIGEQRRLCLAVGSAATRSRVESNLASCLAESKQSKLSILSQWGKLKKKL